MTSKKRTGLPMVWRKVTSTWRIVFRWTPFGPEEVSIGAFFGQSDAFWHRIQSECDFRKLAKDKKRLTADIQPASTLVQTP